MMKGEPMTNDPSITSTAPAPTGSDNTNRESSLCPLAAERPENLSPIPGTPQPDMVKTVGGTTFDIYFHFSQTSRETFADKVLRLIHSDLVTSKK